MTYHMPEAEFGTSYLAVPILEFLSGQPWDAYALGLVYGFANSIRISTGVVKCDARAGRATVFVTEDPRIIKRIELEIKVGLYDEAIANGHDIRVELASRGIEL